MSRIDEMIKKLCPEGVESVKLGDVCASVFAGGTPSTSREDYYDGNIPWIRSGEINFNRIFNAERNITDLGLANSSAKMIKSCSVVMAMTGATVAKVATVEIETSANQSVCALETDKNNLDYRYLYYYLSAHYHDIKSSAQGALTSLNLQMIKALQIPHPPLPIQQEIVSVLDSFTTLIDKMKQEVEKRKKQMEYYREKLLTFEDEECEWKTLGDISTDIYSGATPSTKTKEYWENGNIPWMSSGEVHQGQVYSVEGKISELGYSRCSTKMVPINSVVIALAGQGKTRGTVAITRIELCTNQSLAAIVPNTDIVNPDYLYYYLRGEYMNLRTVSSGDGTRGGLNLRMINEYSIPVIDLATQSSIVFTLDKFESYISKLEKMITLRQKQYEYYREQLLTF